MTRNKTDDATRFARMVGANIKFLRLNRKVFMPQKIPAYVVGVTHQQINKYETGKNIPCAYRLQQLADFFKVTCDDLVNPGYIHKQTKANEVKALTPQDAGYLKPQEDIGSMEEITNAQLDAAIEKVTDRGVDDDQIKMVDEEHFNRQLNK